MQTPLLAITAAGLAGCARGALSHYPDIVRANPGIAPGAQLMCGVAFGHIDPENPVNQTRTDRAPGTEPLKYPPKLGQ